jgi:uncharacterized membrane protein
MRSIIKFGLVSCLFLILSLLPQRAVLASEQIKSFKSEISINADASIDVVEEIAYDFGTSLRHGIFRDIPVVYDAGDSTRTIELTQVAVVGSNGSAPKFAVSYAGDIEKIKIGDPNVTVTGLQTYRISYRVRGAINYFADHDELYWNVTGNGWQVPIASVQAGIKVPGATSSQGISTSCYYGALGSKNECDSRVEPSGLPSANFSSAGLPAGHGMTAVIGFPKGLVAYAEPLAAASASPFAVAMIVIFIGLNILLPIIAFVVMYRRWRRFGKDPKVSTIIPQYDAPAGLTPALVGVVVDDAPTMDSFTGEIINLAIMGYLKIHRLESKMLFLSSEDYELIRLKPADAALSPYQDLLLKALFAGGDTAKLSSLVGKRVAEIGLVDDAVNEAAVKLGYFPENPEKVRNKYMLVGGLMLLGVFVGLFGLFPSGIIVMIFGYLMPVKTSAGVDAKEHLLGLKMYLSVAEKDRLEFHNAPEKNPEQFEKLLPYAVALDVTEQWSKKFEGIYQKNPVWYDDPIRPFTPVLFAQSMGSFKQSFVSSGTAAGGHSGLGGGGHSGGGFGGGGGGSW